MNTDSVDILSRLKLPGETIGLPSKGLLYPTGVLDENVINGEVYVYPMSSYDELIMKTPDKLFSGQAITDVLSRCIPQVLQPWNLFVKDIEMLLVIMRKLTYGSQYNVTYTHDCKKAKNHEYNINLDQLLQNVIKLDPTTIHDLSTITTPNGQILKFTPVTFKSFTELQQIGSLINIDNIKSANTMSSSDTDEMINFYYHHIVSTIHSIDGITDKDIIIQWCKQAPSTWIKNIIQPQSNKLSNWGISDQTSIKCLDCGSSVDISLPLNPMIFFSSQ